MEIRKITHADAQSLLNFYQTNRSHLAPWEPERDESFYTLHYWQDQIRNRLAEMEADRAVYFLSISPASEVVAVCNLTNIVRGVFQAAYMGYAVAEKYQGKGLMKALCVHVLDYAFNELKLNRVMSNYLPHNERSGKLLESLGFEREGYAKRYLKINGHWQDHILTSCINPQK